MIQLIWNKKDKRSPNNVVAYSWCCLHKQAFSKWCDTYAWLCMYILLQASKFWSWPYQSFHLSPRFILFTSKGNCLSCPINMRSVYAKCSLCDMFNIAFQHYHLFGFNDVLPNKVIAAEDRADISFPTSWSSLLTIFNVYGNPTAPIDNQRCSVSKNVLILFRSASLNGFLKRHNHSGRLSRGRSVPPK
jgi:hypothetical protein